MPLEVVDCFIVLNLQVLDYCVDPSSFDASFSSKSLVDVMPAVYKITLKPSMESIAKDVSSMVDETWTYKDLMVCFFSSYCKEVVWLLSYSKSVFTYFLALGRR